MNLFNYEIYEGKKDLYCLKIFSQFKLLKGNYGQVDYRPLLVTKTNNRIVVHIRRSHLFNYKILKCRHFTLVRFSIKINKTS